MDYTPICPPGWPDTSVIDRMVMYQAEVRIHHMEARLLTMWMSDPDPAPSNYLPIGVI